MRAGTLGVVVGFDEDHDPVVHTFGWWGWDMAAPEFRHAVEVVSENR